jgi:hypothetical protein
MLCSAATPKGSAHTPLKPMLDRRGYDSLVTFEVIIQSLEILYLDMYSYICVSVRGVTRCVFTITTKSGN